VVFAQLARALQRWLPTRIVEAEQPCGPLPGSGTQTLAQAAVTPAAARASALTRSPKLMARWQARRREAVEAVQAALADGWLNAPAPLPDDRRQALAHLLHKLAGTAAMFGEAELGEAASALERALLAAASGAALTALAQALLTQAEALAAPDKARRAHG